MFGCCFQTPLMCVQQTGYRRTASLSTHSVLRLEAVSQKHKFFFHRSTILFFFLFGQLEVMVDVSRLPPYRRSRVEHVLAEC